MLSATTFSADGNAAATPVQKVPVNKERQLIAGRNFDDILEACRPRRTGIFPSPLRALISTYLPKICDDDETVGSDTLLKEWDCSERREIPGAKSKLAQKLVSSWPSDQVPQLPTISASPVSDSSSEIADVRARMMLGMSPGASSQYSNLLGVSYDRPLLLHQNSRSFNGTKLQRIPALRMDRLEDALNDNNSHDSPIDVNVRRERLWKAMSEIDSAISRPKPDPKVLSSDSWVNRNESTHAFEAKTAPVSTAQEGIGAALSRYGSGGSARLSHDGENTTFVRLTRANSHAFLLGSSPSYRSRFADMSARGVSPLLLPPVAASIAAAPTDLANVGTLVGNNKLEQRLVHPGEYSGSVAETTARFRRGGSSTQLFRSQSRTANRREATLSVSPPINSSNGVIRAVMDRPRSKSRDRHHAKPKTRQDGTSRRKARVFNPFRQEEEEEVLAKKSHNRRRWSHVFPLGEAEFKRHVSDFLTMYIGRDISSLYEFLGRSELEEFILSSDSTHVHRLHTSTARNSQGLPVQYLQRVPQRVR